MSEHQVFPGGDYITSPNQNADVLKLIYLTDPNLAELYLEMTDLLITDLKWDPVVASRYALDWAADSYFSEKYKLRFPDYYE